MTSLIPWKRNNPSRASSPSSLSPVTRLRWDMDRMFDRFFEGFWDDGPSLGFASPGVHLDLSETDEYVRVRAELPGIDPKDLDISLSGDVLVLSGEKRDEFESEDGNRTYSERRFGSFRRAIQLPCAVDPDAVEAEHKNGVLTVTLNKSEETRPRRIEVKTS